MYAVAGYGVFNCVNGGVMAKIFVFKDGVFDAKIQHNYQGNLKFCTEEYAY